MSDASWNSKCSPSPCLNQFSSCSIKLIIFVILHVSYLFLHFRYVDCFEKSYLKPMILPGLWVATQILVAIAPCFGSPKPLFKYHMGLFYCHRQLKVANHCFQMSLLKNIYLICLQVIKNWRLVIIVTPKNYRK